MTAPGSDSTLQFVGTATTLLHHGGLTVLTDPNFLHRGQRAYLGRGLTSRRLTEPALRVDQLPPVDVVVLSHLHGDHFDRVAARGLSRDLPIVTTRHAARKLRLRGFVNAVALDTWQSHEIRKDGTTLRITAMPGRHAYGRLQTLLPPVMGSVLDFRTRSGPLSVYVTGDTLVYDDLREIPRRHPGLDLGLWHLGGTRILGRLVTMDGAQGADLLEMVTPRTTVPIHYDDYTVFKSPLRDFLAEVDRRGLPGVRPVPRGELVRLPPPPRAV
jgi:L-ascorbate metabolism protein UlaG (beta-lactamase superfamily)